MTGRKTQQSRRSFSTDQFGDPMGTSCGQRSLEMTNKVVERRKMGISSNERPSDTKGHSSSEDGALPESSEEEASQVMPLPFSTVPIRRRGTHCSETYLSTPTSAWTYPRYSESDLT